MLRKGLQLKSTRPVSLLSVVSKVFEKLVNNRIVDHLEKCGFFSVFQYGFRSSQSTADLLTVAYDRNARVFNRCRATRAVALDISKAFERVLHAGLLHKRKYYGVSGQIFGLIFFFLSDKRLRVVLDGKSSQEYSVSARVLQGSILGPTPFLLYINELPDDFFCDIAIYADNTTLCSKCDETSDLWRQPKLASVFESDLRDTVDWGRGRRLLVDFNAGKTQLVLFDRSNNTGAIDVKMDGSALKEKSSLKMLGLTFSSKLDWGSYIISIAKTASKKIVALVHTVTYKKETIWDIYGKREYNIFKTGLADTNDSEDFKAKFLSLKPRLKKLCPGFYNWFLTHHKKEFLQSVTKSAR